MYLKIGEVAKRLNVSRNTVQVIVERGELPAIKVGSQTRILQSAYDDYIRRQAIATQNN